MRNTGFQLLSSSDIFITSRKDNTEKSFQEKYIYSYFFFISIVYKVT